MAMSSYDAWVAGAGGREALDEAMRRRVTMPRAEYFQRIRPRTEYFQRIRPRTEYFQRIRPRTEYFQRIRRQAILRAALQELVRAGLPEPSPGWRDTVPIDGLGSPLRG